MNIFEIASQDYLHFSVPKNNQSYFHEIDLRMTIILDLQKQNFFWMHCLEKRKAKLKEILAETKKNLDYSLHPKI